MSYDVRAATARLGGLSSYGRTPDPEAKAAAERTLATARIDREIRESMGKYGPLDPAQVTHLVGLVLSFQHVKGDVFASIEQRLRIATENAAMLRDVRTETEFSDLDVIAMAEDFGVLKDGEQE